MAGGNDRFFTSTGETPSVYYQKHLGRGALQGLGGLQTQEEPSQGQQNTADNQGCHLPVPSAGQFTLQAILGYNKYFKE